jgi:dihydropteroate synthase
MLLRCAGRDLDLTTPAVMGILNVTPDSFSDGGSFTDVDAALAHARAMVEQGARIVDVGGESTRPGAIPISRTEEVDRVAPVIERLVSEFDIIVSVDTRHAEVARAALAAGAHLLNDVAALTGPGMLATAAGSTAAVCLMHMQGEPGTMQLQPHYEDVVAEVQQYLATRLQACDAIGIARDRIVIDPGIGFGKNLHHNLALLAHIPRLCTLGVPVMIGVSRKSMFKQLLGRDLHERLPGTVSATCAAVLAGAALVRAHDVAAAVDAVRVATALRESGYSVQ